MGLTQQELADKIKMPLATYRKKEQGESKFNIEEAYILSKLCGKSIEEIFFANQ